MILLWGLPNDPPTASVRAALAAASLPVAFVDQRATLETGVRLQLGDRLSGCMDIAGTTLDLESVTSAFVRPYDGSRLPAIERLGPNTPPLSHTRGLERALWLWAQYMPGLVVNRPSAMLRTTSKPYQLSMIRKAGFAVPETLITTDPQAVDEFLGRHGTVIYKSISSMRSIVARLTESERGRFADVRWCPTQFQEYVPGVDFRVHVVGTELFCCEIASEAVDYRYAGRQGASIEMRPAVLPDECVKGCRQLSAEVGLAVAGIDLRRTPDGAWFCFEINASPAFSFFECTEAGSIAAAVARLLAGGGLN